MSTRAFLALMLAAVLAFITLPQILALLSAGGASTYTGIHGYAAADFNVYFSQISQAEHGRFLFQNLFTAESTAATIFNPFWLLVGLVGGLFRLSPEVAFHAARILGAVGVFVLLWRFVCTVFSETVPRRLAFFGFFFAGGIGAYAMLIDPSGYPDITAPMDVWVMESSVLTSMLHSAHFIVGTGLLLGSFWLVIRALERNAWMPSIWAGLLLLALFSFHPFHVVTVGLVLLLVAFGEALSRKMTWRRLALLALPLALSLPAILYAVWSTFFDPSLAARAAQNVNRIPPLGATLISYGFLLPLALLGAARLFRGRLRQRFVLWWALAHAAVLFSPIFFSRRLSQGLDIPLTILAVAGAMTLFSLLKQRQPGGALRHARAWGLIGVFLFCISPVYVLAQDFQVILRTEEYRVFFFRPKAEQEGYAALQRLSTAAEPFFSGAITGNVFAAHALRHAYIAHTVETLSFEEKIANLRAFFRSWRPEERAAFLAREGLHWVVLRVEEFPYADVVEETPGVSPAFRNGAVRIYRFSPEES